MINVGTDVTTVIKNLNSEFLQGKYPNDNEISNISLWTSSKIKQYMDNNIFNKMKYFIYNLHLLSSPVFTSGDFVFVLNGTNFDKNVYDSNGNSIICPNKQILRYSSDNNFILVYNPQTTNIRNPIFYIENIVQSTYNSEQLNFKSLYEENTYYFLDENYNIFNMYKLFMQNNLYIDSFILPEFLLGFGLNISQNFNSDLDYICHDYLLNEYPIINSDSQNYKIQTKVKIYYRTTQNFTINIGNNNNINSNYLLDSSKKIFITDYIHDLSNNILENYQNCKIQINNNPVDLNIDKCEILFYKILK